MAHSAGFEPAALGFVVRYSIQLSYECARREARLASLWECVQTEVDLGSPLGGFFVFFVRTPEAGSPIAGKFIGFFFLFRFLERLKPKKASLFKEAHRPLRQGGGVYVVGTPKGLSAAAHDEVTDLVLAFCFGFLPQGGLVLLRSAFGGVFV